MLFNKFVHYISAKIILVSSASIFGVYDRKGKGISRRNHYIFCLSVMLGTAYTA